jgi:Na+/proline symporter
MGLLLAGPLWRRKLVTLADLLRERFSGGVEQLAAVLLIPTSLLWAAAQVRALGQVLAVGSEMDVAWAIVLAGGIAMLYTTLGGLMADAISDLIQAVLLTLGLLLLLSATVVQLGGPGPALAAITPARVRLVPEVGASGLALLEEWSIPVLGSLLAQEVVSRVSAARTIAVARIAPLAAGGIYILVGLIPVTIGLLAPGLLGHIEHREMALPLLAERHLPSIFYLVFVGALVSAILSTVDSTLLVAGSLFSHNLVGRWRPGLAERTKVAVARGAVMGSGVIACLLALSAEGVQALVEQASAFCSAGVAVAVLFGLFTTFGGRASAYAALIFGALVYCSASILGCPIPYLASLAAALIGYLALGHRR